MYSVFTIVAKNYLAMALTLGDSLKAVHPDYEFTIFLADAVDDDIILSQQRFKIIEVKHIGIDNWLDLAFKYDISEFSTSIKPFCFEFLATTNKYNYILYFDPDIYIYNELTLITDAFKDNFCVVTPHHCDLEIDWKGALPENNILIAGVYNLGFIGFRDCDAFRFIIEWWKKRLRDKCYLERMEGLFYDQNWVQFLGSSFDRGVHVLRDYGHNVAWWNLHERHIEFKEGDPYVIHKRDMLSFKCVFYHFSGFNVLDPTIINNRYKANPFFQLEFQTSLKRLFEEYAKKVLLNGHNSFSRLKYKYNNFENGYVISKFHRRLYKEITTRQTGYRNMDSVYRALVGRCQNIRIDLVNPFSCKKDSYYELLSNNRLVIEKESFALDNLNPDRDSVKFNSIIHMALTILVWLKTMVGIKNYLTLMKFINIYSRDEYQIFLIKKYSLKKK